MQAAWEDGSLYISWSYVFSRTQLAEIIAGNPLRPLTQHEKYIHRHYCLAPIDVENTRQYRHLKLQCSHSRI